MCIFVLYLGIWWSVIFLLVFCRFRDVMRRLGFGEIDGMYLFFVSVCLSVLKWDEDE